MGVCPPSPWWALLRGQQGKWRPRQPCLQAFLTGGRAEPYPPSPFLAHLRSKRGITRRCGSFSSATPPSPLFKKIAEAGRSAHLIPRGGGGAKNFSDGGGSSRAPPVRGRMPATSEATMA